MMDVKSNNLIKSLSLAYDNSTIKNNTELSQLIAECVRPLMGNNDDKVYFEVVGKLSHGISKYYRANNNTVPNEFLVLYDQIKKDVPKKSVEGKRLLRQFKDDKLAKIGILI